MKTPVVQVYGRLQKHWKPSPQRSPRSMAARWARLRGVDPSGFSTGIAGWSNNSPIEEDESSSDWALSSMSLTWTGADVLGAVWTGLLEVARARTALEDERRRLGFAFLAVGDSFFPRATALDGLPNKAVASLAASWAFEPVMGRFRACKRSCSTSLDNFERSSFLAVARLRLRAGRERTMMKKL